jgi:hypothetical protein
MEYDMPAARAVPACAAVTTATRWLLETFERAGFDPDLGPRLVSLFGDAGLGDVATLGAQLYLPPADAARMLAGIVRTLLPVIERTGVASPADVDVGTLENRIAGEMRGRQAVFSPPTLVGAWATKTESS